MSNKNKQHGKYFESKIATKFREVLELKEHECTRSPDSGLGEFEFGDIYFNDPIKYPYSLECKFGYNCDLTNMFPKLSKQITTFLHQSLEEKNKLESKMKIKCLLNCVIMSKPYYSIYVLTYELLCDKIPYIKTLDSDCKDVYIYDFDSLIGSDFFEKCRRISK